jgi:hypothetical protein
MLVTMSLAGEEPARATATIPGTTVQVPDLTGYRSAVADLVKELAGRARSGGARHVERIRAERILARRLAEPEITPVLAATPHGLAGAAQRLLSEVRNYQPSQRSSAADLTAQIRISMLTQVDAMWWGAAPAYESDEQLLSATDLVDIESLRRGGALRFRYRRQAATVLARAIRSAERRVWPSRTPNTAGLRFARIRPEAAAMLNQLATEFAALAPSGTPPLWVTSLARSVEHQRHLRSLGYSAALPSAHCVGYAADIEMAWFRRYRADSVLQGLLLDLQQAGDVNVIDEGQAWHVCISPAGGRGLRRVRRARAEG